MATFGSDFRTWIFDSSNSDDMAVASGPAGARIGLKIHEGKLFVMVDGEPDGDALLDAFKQGLATGKLKHNMQTLVDLTRFTGAVDWGALTALRDMAPWGKDEGEASRVAYIVRNDAFAILIKAAQGLFFLTQHKIFSGHNDALAWLEAPG